MKTEVAGSSAACRLGPNRDLIGVPGSRARLATPALVLDLDACERNLEKVAVLARNAQLALRSHAKTHKCTAVAQLQNRLGAIGISVATVREAEAMVDARLSGVLVTSPVAGSTKIDALVSLLDRSETLMVVVDTPSGAEALARSVKRAGRRMSVLVDLDIGLNRTGVTTVSAALALVRRIQELQVLDFAGLQAYPGSLQRISSLARRAEVYESHLNRLEAVLEALARSGTTPGIVSGGGTGTFEIDCRRGLLTECQPGSYVFMDSQYREIELSSSEPHPLEVALFVQATVVSNHHPGFATVDAGVKSFATDGPVPMPVSGVPAGTRYRYCGDEFGLLEIEEGVRLDIGTPVEFITPHCDPTVNLHDVYHCVRGDVLVDIWPIDARGSL